MVECLSGVLSGTNFGLKVHSKNSNVKNQIPKFVLHCIKVSGNVTLLNLNPQTTNTMFIADNRIGRSPTLPFSPPRKLSISSSNTVRPARVRPLVIYMISNVQNAITQP